MITFYSNHMIELMRRLKKQEEKKKNCKARHGNRSIRKGREPSQVPRTLTQSKVKLVQDLPFGKVWSLFQYPSPLPASFTQIPRPPYPRCSTHSSVRKYLNGCLVPACSDTKYDSQGLFWNFYYSYTIEFWHNDKVLRFGKYTRGRVGKSN